MSTATRSKPAAKKAAGDPLMVCTETHAFGVETFHRDKSRARASHPAVQANPHWWQPVDGEEHPIAVPRSGGDVEAATAEPGEQRGAPE